MTSFLSVSLLIAILWAFNKRYYFGKVFVIKVAPLSVKLLKGSVSNSFLNEARIISKNNKVNGYSLA